MFGIDGNSREPAPPDELNAPAFGFRVKEYKP